MDLTSYDWIVANSSAGKDSQAMLDLLVEQATAQNVRSRLVVVHADLGRAEWQGTKALAAAQAEHYGVRFEVVRKPGADLLERVRERRMWPSPRQRWCTSDLKRTPVSTLFTRLVREHPSRHYRPVRILNCLGLRAEESPARSRRPVFAHNTRQTNSRRVVDDYLPIHSWTVGQVWERIEQSGVPHHRAYDLGMPRLSCVLCIFAPKAALVLAGRHNPELLAEYTAVEAEIGHTFRMDTSLADVAAAVAAGEGGSVSDWKM